MDGENSDRNSSYSGTIFCNILHTHTHIHTHRASFIFIVDVCE